MKVNRRVFLNSVCIGAPIALGSYAMPARSSDPKPFMLVIDGISPSTPAAKLFSFLDPIISQGVPVGCVLQLFEDDQQPASNPELIELLCQLGSDYSGLFEIILGVPGLADQNGYFRMRRAGDAQTLFRQMQADISEPTGQMTNSLTLATEQPAGTPPDFDGVRSAGFQNVILLPSERSPAEIWRTNDGTQLIFGGRRLAVSSDKNESLKAISEELTLGHPLVLVATFPDATELGEEELFNRGAALGDAVSISANSGNYFMTLPSDLQLMSGESVSRNLVLCVEDNSASASQTMFLGKLNKANISFTQLRLASDGRTEYPDDETAGPIGLPAHTCWAVENGSQTSWEKNKNMAFTKPITSYPLTATCAGFYNSPVGLTEDASAGLDLLVDLSKSGSDIVGLDKFGALRMSISVEIDGVSGVNPASVLREKIGEPFQATKDNLVLIRSSAFENETDGNMLVEVLSELQKRDNIDVVDLRQHLGVVSVKNEPARLLRSAHRHPIAPVEKPPGTSELATLLEDARHAWSYFERLTDPATGLAPATAWTEGDTIASYNFTTMWDTGSHIQALISAHTIGLIDGGEFHDRSVKLLGSLADDLFGGLLLPRGLSSTDGKAPGENEYNASDTARLLTALKTLQNYSTKDLGIADIVSRWDIAKTFKDGVPQTVRNGQFVSAYASNYAGYISRGFGAWGYNPAWPYSLSEFEAGMDSDVSTLHEVASFGPIGTEPHLQEAVELGFSDVARATSEALFAAQVEEFEATGKLKCISEAPINREPWFVYHGYQIGHDTAEHWTAETLDNSGRFKTKGFLRAIEMLNSKAAYLWHVVRPGDYSTLLVEQVREKARNSELGFAPGIFSATGQPVQDYSDVNTNGVILQAIAFCLNAERPASTWRDTDRLVK